jgi:hypothetical protein
MDVVPQQPLVPRFRADGLAIKLIGLTLFAAGCAVGSVWAGIVLGQTWGLNPADGGVLLPLGQRIALGIGVASLGLAFLAGMLFYWRYYIIRIEIEDNGRTVLIGRLYPFPQLRLPVEDVTIGSTVRGEYRGFRFPVYSRMAPVDAPWLNVRLRGWRVPMVLDLHGKFLDDAPSKAGAERG